MIEKRNEGISIFKGEEDDKLCEKEKNKYMLFWIFLR